MTRNKKNNIELPIKKTKGNTIEERLNQNTYKRILPARYLRKDKEGNLVESQEEIFERVAKNVALPEAYYEAQRQDKKIKIKPKHIKYNHSKREELVEEVFGEKVHPEDEKARELETELDEKNIKNLSYNNLYEDLPEEVQSHLENVKNKFQEHMENLDYIPNSPCLMNAGDELQQLSACFVLSPEDNMDDIHHKAKQASKVFKSGGGCGYGFWKLRPKGDKVGSSGGVSSGPLSFMRTYDQVCSTVAQGGCVSSDTRIMTTEGYKKISELHKDEKRLIERKQSNELIETPDGMHSYMETSSSGSMSVYEINTESGYNIKGSKDHLVLCIEEGKLEFKQLQEINEGDKVVLSQENSIPNTDEVLLETLDEKDKNFNSQSVNLPEKMTEDISFFLGYLWADGSFNPEENRFLFCVSNTEKEQRLKERLISTIENWNIDYKVCESSEGDYEEIRFVSSQVSNWMFKNGFTKDLDRIPRKIYQKPEFFKDFLAGMSADSSYSKDSKVIKYSTISKNLANNIQDMLMCMGIPTNIIKERKDAFGDNPVYLVRTLPGKSSEKYDKQVPHPYEDHNLGEGRQKQNKIDFADDLVSRELEKEFTGNNKLPDNIDKTAMKELRKYEKGEITPSRKRLKEMFKKVDIENVEELNEQYYYDTVIQKGKKENVKVYDIEVIHDNEYYVGNNFVTHNKRRGAQMGVMRITHPDIIEFIHSKNKDVSLAHTLKLNDPDDFTHTKFSEALEEARDILEDYGGVPKHLRNAVEGHLSNFNISVGITDDFMEAVYNDEMWKFENPRTEETFIANSETKEMYEMFGLGEYVEEGEVLEVPAVKLWEHIIEGAHENGEPGVVYLERMNKESAFDPEEHPEKRVKSTNPCLTGDMKVAVADGRQDVEIQKLAEEDERVPVFTHNKETGEIEVRDSIAFKTKENAETIKIKTDVSTTLKLTPDHEVYTNNKGKIEAQELEPGDSLVTLKLLNTEEIGRDKSAVGDNHKVTSIEKTEGTKDVYDMTVPDTHNFYVGRKIVEDKTNDKKYYVKVSNCGEQELFDYDACNLSHINLSTILDVDCDIQDYRVFSEKNDESDLTEVVEKYLDQVVDWDDLDERISYNTRFLDNVVTMSDFPVDKIEKTTHNVRKIGLGIMGYAQMLVQMGVEYGSEEADEIARQLMNYINNKSVSVSKSLAVDNNPGMDRGVFEDWDDSKWSNPIEYKDWFEREYTDGVAEEWEDGFPVRNHSHTTIAPTGTTSQIGNTSGGCEPIFSVANFKNVSEDIQGDEMLVQFDDFFLRVLEANDIEVDDVKSEAVDQMNNNEFNGVEGLESVPDEIGELFVTTSDLSAIEHASVQCAFQEGVSSSISKTVNAPNDASLEDTRNAFEYVYDNGGKGVTYYRDGTRSKQVLTTRKDNKEFAEMNESELLEAVRDLVSEDEELLDDLLSMLKDLEDEEGLVIEEFVDSVGEDLEDMNEDLGVSESRLGLSEYRKRPDNLVGATVRISTGYGTLYVTLNEDEDGELFEVFAEIGKSGGLKSSFTEGLSRMISMSLRYGVPPERVMKHLSSIKSSKTNWDNGDTVHSVPDGVALALERYLNAGGVVGLLEKQRGDDFSSDSEVEYSKDEVSRSMNVSGEECPECGNNDLSYSEGCIKCHECGWSKC